MKRTHSRHRYHLSRLGLASVLLAMYCAVQLDAHRAFTPSTPSPSHSSVLSYASEMSVGGLLAGTNASRSANGLGALRNSAALNNSAQMKAQDMANKDYWAHVSPDGTQPWYFFQAAGYGYSRAGENLAYGFMTSQSTIDGWLGSPTHRANMLGDYVDVGFGIVNAPNYQGSGNQTIVVAHYGTPLNYSPPAPAPAPAPAAAPAPTPKPAAAPTTATPPPASTPAAAPTTPTPSTAEPTSQETPTAAQPTQQKEKSQPQQPGSEVQTATTKPVSLLDLFRQKRAPLLALAALGTTSVVIVGYAATHRRAFQHALVSGEQFAMKHPTIDAAIVLAIIALMLLTSYGHIG